MRDYQGNENWWQCMTHTNKKGMTVISNLKLIIATFRNQDHTLITFNNLDKIKIIPRISLQCAPAKIGQQHALQQASI